MSKMEIVIGVLGVLVGLMSVILAKFGGAFEKKAKATPTQIDDMILKYAKVGVDYANEYFNGSSNDTKKKMATLEVFKGLASEGIKEVSTEAVGQAIETIIKENKEQAVEKK